jgi:glycosyltransferase involved in cell wall biosynthesis
MRFLLGAQAHNQHVQNIARALYEAGALAGYMTAGVDHYRHSWSRGFRQFVGSAVPGVEARLARRKVRNLPENLVHTDWTWEGFRALVHQLGISECAKDWVWDRSEHSFDRHCARSLATLPVDGFIGVEYGCLSALQTASSLGTSTVVAFLSPHHQVLRETVFTEYEQFPELLTPYVKRQLRLLPERTARKDAEARLADCIHTASRFTAESLVKAGFPREKMTIVPLGCPLPISEDALAPMPSRKAKFIYAGPFSVRKGAHYLLNAWATLAPGSNAELHVYGLPLLPQRCLNAVCGNVIMHGSVSREELATAYQQSSALIFPTLCDGFGMVAMEALSYGLPVVMTTTAGAADVIEQGKNGFVVPPKNTDALAERMEWCIRHPGDLWEMRRHALATARECTWEKFRADFMEQSARVLQISWN